MYLYVYIHIYDMCICACMHVNTYIHAFLLTYLHTFTYVTDVCVDIADGTYVCLQGLYHDFGVHACTSGTWTLVGTSRTSVRAGFEALPMLSAHRR